MRNYSTFDTFGSSATVGSSVSMSDRVCLSASYDGYTTVTRRLRVGYAVTVHGPTSARCGFDPTDARCGFGQMVGPFRRCRPISGLEPRGSLLLLVLLRRQLLVRVHLILILSSLESYLPS